MPPDITDLLLSKSVTTDLSWSDPGGAASYDLAGGALDDLFADGGTANASCLVDDLGGNGWNDVRVDPAAGEGYYYILRGVNVCGPGTYGNADPGERLPSAACLP